MAISNTTHQNSPQIAAVHRILQGKRVFAKLANNLRALLIDANDLLNYENDRAMAKIESKYPWLDHKSPLEEELLARIEDRESTKSKDANNAANRKFSDISTCSTTSTTGTIFSDLSRSDSCSSASSSSTKYSLFHTNSTASITADIRPLTHSDSTSSFGTSVSSLQNEPKWVEYDPSKVKQCRSVKDIDFFENDSSTENNSTRESFDTKYPKLGDAKAEARVIFEDAVPAFSELSKAVEKFVKNTPGNLGSINISLRFEDLIPSDMFAEYLEMCTRFDDSILQLHIWKTYITGLEKGKLDANPRVFVAMFDGIYADLCKFKRKAASDPDSYHNMAPGFLKKSKEK